MILAILSFLQIPIGVYVLYRTVIALRVTHDRQVRFGLDCMLMVTIAVMVARLTAYSPVEMGRDTEIAVTHGLIAVALLSFTPMINVLVRLGRQHVT
nr:hypothetical protein [uncultured Halomonas sp.]